jgi:hypothetical protein
MAQPFYYVCKWRQINFGVMLFITYGFLPIAMTKLIAYLLPRHLVFSGMWGALFVGLMLTAITFSCSLLPLLNDRNVDAWKNNYYRY